ncbi:MAG: hypothetical protein JXR97_13100 [Planctomycetes bacterium]|nr:hypothetical protein [Planctomycetota bacterium]
MLKLIPLRIPCGWQMLENSLFDPHLSTPEELEPYLDEDIMQIKCTQRDLLVDVGWYGNRNSGMYALHVFRGDWHGEELCVYDTKNIESLVKAIELVLSYCGENFVELLTNVAGGKVNADAARD